MSQRQLSRFYSSFYNIMHLSCVSSRQWREIRGELFKKVLREKKALAFMVTVFQDTLLTRGGVSGVVAKKTRLVVLLAGYLVLVPFH